jgi:broad specificity phosphatase PhoE
MNIYNVSATYPPSEEVCVGYFVRPGLTPTNEGGQKWSGPKDAPLCNENFPAIEVLKGIEFQKGYISTKVLRTKQTADSIFANSKYPKPPVEEVDCLYEMEIGYLESQTPKDIVAGFKKKTGYPDESTKEKLPKLWQRKNGEDPTANECLLDAWEEGIDTFDSYCEKIEPELKAIVEKNKGKGVLFVGHGTPAKLFIRLTQEEKNKNLHVIDIECKKGCFFKFVYYKGKFTLQKDMCEGVSLLNGENLKME